MKTFSPDAIQALKDALTYIYWKKQDIKNFIYHTVTNKSIISTINWDTTKAESIGILIDRMLKRPDIYEEDLLKLFDVTIHFNEFSHLKYWEDPEKKIERAKNAVAALRNHAQGYFQLKEEKKQVEERRAIFENMQKEKSSFLNQLKALKDDFIDLSCQSNPQKRGFAFEKFLNSLFLLFDLAPKSSFRIDGEQIDGAFTFDGNDFLLEAKWQNKPINLTELYSFSGKIQARLKLTLGLYISVNGFTDSYKNNSTENMRSMLLMDGLDLIAVLDNRIDLKDMLFRKRRYASETGDIFLRYADMK